MGLQMRTVTSSLFATLPWKENWFSPRNHMVGGVSSIVFCWQEDIVTGDVSITSLFRLRLTNMDESKFHITAVWRRVKTLFIVSLSKSDRIQLLCQGHRDFKAQSHPTFQHWCTCTAAPREGNKHYPYLEEASATAPTACCSAHPDGKVASVLKSRIGLVPKMP